METFENACKRNQYVYPGLTKETTLNKIRAFCSNKGKDMNEHTDQAFAPMDEAPRPNVGPQADGTVSYQIVEGDTFVDGKLVKKDPEVVGYVQLEESND